MASMVILVLSMVKGSIFEVEFILISKELWKAYSNHTFSVTVTLTLTSDLVFIVITMSVPPSFRPASCPVHISYII